MFDANGDGRSDVLLMNHGLSRLELLEQQADRRFVRNRRFDPVVIDPHGCTTLDVNADNRTDVYLANGACSGTCTKVNQLMVQRPDGTWIDQAAVYGVTDPLGRGRVPLAFNADGDRSADLFLGNEVSATRPNRLFRGGASRMTEVISPTLTRGVGAGCATAGDIDADGRAELVVCTRSLGLQVYEFNGTTMTTVDVGAPVGVVAEGAELADLDSDGDLDLVVVTRRQVTFHLNVARRLSGTWPAVAIGAGHDVAVADANGDRLADVFVVQGNNAALRDVLLVNQGGGRFLAVPAPLVGGDGDKVAAISGYLGPGRAAFVVNNGRFLASGPRQLLVLP